MSKGKSLSERLAELANPTPHFADPEDEYNDESKARLESFDDQYELHDNTQVVKNKAPKNKSNLRQKNVELLAVSDSRYAGKRVSRKDLNSLIEEGYKSSESSLESENESGEDNILEFKNKFMKETNNKSKKPHTFQESEDESVSLKSDNHEEDGNESELNKSEDYEEADFEEGEEEGEEEVEEEGEEEEEKEGEEEGEEEGDIGSVDDSEGEENEKVKKLSKNSHDNDINKGKSIQNQLSLWDHLLECRIKMHKGINLCNQLPQAPSNYKLFTKASGENHFVAAGQGAQVAIKSLLDNCLELEELLLKSNPQTKALTQRKSNEEGSDEEIPSDTDEEAGEDHEDIDDGGPKRKKQKIVGYESEIGERHEKLRGFWHRTLNMWNEKTRLASGRTGSGSKAGFGAFDQSILKQIEGILSDKQRLINRTRIKRATYRILGSISKLSPKENTNNGKGEEHIQDDKNLPEIKEVDYEEFDPEIYDDDDFYHQLLRELIEKKTGEAGSNQIALGRQWLEIQKLRSKAKRKVDSKASKGRRLRYQVHPKLVSFMAPYPEASWNDIAKNELFASLFGSGPTVK